MVDSMLSRSLPGWKWERLYMILTLGTPNLGNKGMIAPVAVHIDIRLRNDTEASCRVTILPVCNFVPYKHHPVIPPNTSI